MGFKATLAEFFPGALGEEPFVAHTHAVLAQHGFTRDNTIACVCVCRDEIAQPFVTRIHARWGEAFNLASLGGMFLAGTTAVEVAMQHSPNRDGCERYVFFAFTHIALDEHDALGVCLRAGREGRSVACGALDLFQRKLARGTFTLARNKHDIEQSLLEERLVRETLFGQQLSLYELTKLAQKASQQDLEDAVRLVVNTTRNHYAIVTGIQVHGPNENYVWLADFYAVINGNHCNLKG